MCIPKVTPRRGTLVKTMSNWVVWGWEMGWVMFGAWYMLLQRGHLEGWKITVFIPSPRLPTKGTYNKPWEIIAFTV